MNLNDIVELNAHEEAWLPDLLQEFISENPDMTREAAILILSEAITKLTTTGSIGVFSYVPSNKNDQGEEFGLGTLSLVLTNPVNWEYGKITQPVYALFNKQKSQQAGTGQPATRPVLKSEGSDKPQPESEGRSR